ncbi:hypothetical protein NL50_03565 [Clostridium acetobutylicum]|nr:hypothetical protein NL50_03565 [Clostridium acetobutylicum]
MINTEGYGTLLITNGINRVKLGEKTWIILDANSSTGYVWRLTLDNSKVYRIDKNFYLPSRTGSVGTPGKAVWILKAIKKGEASIVLNYARVFDKEALKSIVYSIIVE